MLRKIVGLLILLTLVAAATTIFTTRDSVSSASPSFSVAAAPANGAPVAVDDSYDLPEDTQLIRSAPGVLVNDTGTEGSALSAVLVSPVTHGVLRLKADGSFTYSPDSHFVGTDSFTYKVSDGTGESNIATVTINIKSTGSAGVSPWVWVVICVALVLLGSALFLWWRRHKEQPASPAPRPPSEARMHQEKKERNDRQGRTRDPSARSTAPPVAEAVVQTQRKPRRRPAVAPHEALELDSAGTPESGTVRPHHKTGLVKRTADGGTP